MDRPSARVTRRLPHAASRSRRAPRDADQVKPPEWQQRRQALHERRGCMTMGVVLSRGGLFSFGTTSPLALPLRRSLASAGRVM